MNSYNIGLNSFSMKHLDGHHELPYKFKCTVLTMNVPRTERPVNVTTEENPLAAAQGVI